MSGAVRDRTRMSDSRVNLPPCPWNPKVDCGEQGAETCRRCGWNFVVAYERKQFIRETGVIPKIFSRSVIDLWMNTDADS